jgi:hypothetical protein
MKPTSTPMRSIVLVAVSILIALGACISSSPQTTQPALTPEGGGKLPGSGRELQCEALGYPCSYADAAPEALERSAQALGQAAAVLDETGDMASAADVFRQRDDLAELIYGPEALSFRLEDGPETWLVNGDALATGSKGSGLAADGGVIGSSHPTDTFTLEPPQDDGPIGESRHGVEPYKKALILSPFWWDFKGDETEQVADLIRTAHRNYECAEGCEVTWKHNTVRDQGQEESPEEYLLTKTLSLNQEVSLTDYSSWKDYDLIHVSSHGFQLCKDGACKGIIMTGRFVNKPEWTATGEPDFGVPGVVWGRTAVPGCSALNKKLESDGLSDNEWTVVYEQWLNKGCATYPDRWWQFITPDFFTAAYSGEDLDDKLIFINSCESMKDLALAKSLAGNNTTVLGWDQVVNVDAAGKVALAFYNLYVTNGIRASIAFNHVKVALEPFFQDPALRGFRPKGIEIESLAPPDFLQEGDDDTRGREIITLLQPISRDELQERDAVPTLGVPGDGQPDKVLLLVQVDGIDESQTAGDFVVHFAADGEELNDTITPQEPIGEYSYLAIGLMDLPFDASSRRFIQLEAWVDLPEGGQSRHVLDEVELANCGWTATLSGNHSGQIKGDIAVPTSTISSATVEQLSELQTGGLLGPGESSGADLPSPSQLAAMPDSFMLGNRDQFPFMFLIPDQSGTVMFAGNELAVGQQVTVSPTEETATRQEGSFSTTLVELRDQQTFSAQGEYTWHRDSLCSMDVILALAADPFPESMIPPGLGQ